MSEPVITPDVIRAGTVNLARLMPETEARADAIIAEIDSMDLDLFGGQETEEWIEARLRRRLKGGWIVVSDHVNCPAFVRADRFEPVKWNGKSSIKITMPGSVRRRYGSAALLKRKSDGLVFVFATIHPSNNGESRNASRDRIWQAESCWDHLELWGVTDYPILLVGDMNDKSMSPNGLPGVFVSHGMTDILAALGQRARIDRAFCKGFFAVSAAVNAVVSSASDHDFGVFVVSTAPPAPEPPAFPVKMYVRPLGDPIWKAPPFELTARNARGDFITPPIVRPAGAEVVGVVVDLINDKFVRTDTGEHYRMTYLTTERPAPPVEPEPVQP